MNANEREQAHSTYEWIFDPEQYSCLNCLLAEYIKKDIRLCNECNQYRHKDQMKSPGICKHCNIVTNRWK